MEYGIFTLTFKGGLLGGRIKKLLKGAELYLPERFKGKKTDGVKFFRSFRDEVFSAFYRYNGLIFIMAAGVVVRTIAPLLKGKDKDPAVVVIDEKGRYVISLLSGHLGGANELARRIAGLIDAEPVVTTATDVNGLPCIEEIAFKLGCVIEDTDKIKLVNSAIVNGGRVCFIDEDTERLERLKGFVEEKIKIQPRIKYGAKFKIFTHNSQLTTLDSIKEIKADAIVIITEKVFSDFLDNAIFLRPRGLVVGIGCRRGVDSEEIERAYLETLLKWGISPLSVKRLATIDIKRGEEGLLNFARRYKLEIDFYSKDKLSDVEMPSGSSIRVMERVGIGGVCEPSAMKSAGVEDIWLKKQKIGRVTIAVAKEPFIL